MKTKYLLFSLMACIGIFFSSCVKSVDTDLTKQYTEWKQKNDQYFSAMKDSTSYTLYQLPAEQGGSCYYYKILKAGQEGGAKPLSTDNVKVNYRGKLINGTVFDETYTYADPTTDEKAKPNIFVVNTLIPGWVENLKQMKVGEVRRVVLPYQLGYGDAMVYSILPYSTLIFDIHLVSIESN